MRRSSRALALAALAALAGCAQGLPLGPEVRVSGQGFEAVQGETDLVVRAHTFDAAGRRLEVGGAVCEVSSILYRTRLVTPARLALPSFGPASPTLVFDCQAGELAGRAEREVITRWVGPPGGWGWPATGVVIGTGGDAYVGVGGWSWGWGGPLGGAYPVFVYPDVSVELR